MANVDMDKLEQAMIYVGRIADGMDPISGTKMEEDSVLNNPDIIRSMFFVNETLNVVKRNRGFIGEKPKQVTKAEFPAEQVVEKFVYASAKPITYFTYQLNDCINKDQYKRLKYTDLRNALLLQGYLMEAENPENREKPDYISTEKGQAIGITTEERQDHYGQGRYYALYHQTAQEFIVRNLAKLLNGEVDLY